MADTTLIPQIRGRVHIDDRDVGLKLTKPLDGGFTVLRFTDDDHIRLRIDDRPNSLAETRVVVDNENLDFLRGGGHEAD